MEGKKAILALRATNQIARYDTRVREEVSKLWGSDFDSLLWDSTFKTESANAKALRNNLQGISNATYESHSTSGLSIESKNISIILSYLTEKIVSLDVKEFVQTFGAHVPPTVLLAVAYETSFNIFRKNDSKLASKCYNAVLTSGIWESDKKSLSSDFLRGMGKKVVKEIDNEMLKEKHFLNVYNNFLVEKNIYAYTTGATIWNMFRDGVDLTAAMAYENLYALHSDKKRNHAWDYAAHGSLNLYNSDAKNTRGRIRYNSKNYLNDDNIPYDDAESLRGLASRFDFTLLPAVYKFSEMPSSGDIFVDVKHLQDNMLDVERLVSRVPDNFSRQKFVDVYTVMDFHRKYVKKETEYKKNMLSYANKMSRRLSLLKDFPNISNGYQIFEDEDFRSNDTRMRRYSNLSSIYEFSRTICTKDDSIGIFGSVMISLALSRDPSPLRPMTEEDISRRREYSLSFNGAVASIVYSLVMNFTDKMLEDLMAFNRDELVGWAQEFVECGTFSLHGVVPSIYDQGNSRALYGAMYEILGRSMFDFLSFVGDLYSSNGSLSAAGVIYYAALKKVDEQSYDSYMGFILDGNLDRSIVRSISPSLKLALNRKDVISTYDDNNIYPGDVFLISDVYGEVGVVMRGVSKNQLNCLKAKVIVRGDDGELDVANNISALVKSETPFIIEPINYQDTANRLNFDQIHGAWRVKAQDVTVLA